MSKRRKDPGDQGYVDEIKTNRTPWGFLNPPPHHTYKDPKDQEKYDRGRRAGRHHSFLHPNKH